MQNIGTVSEPCLTHRRTPHGLQPRSAFALPAMRMKAHDHACVCSYACILLGLCKTLSSDCFCKQLALTLLSTCSGLPKSHTYFHFTQSLPLLTPVALNGPSYTFFHPGNIRTQEPADSCWLSWSGAAVTMRSVIPTSLLISGEIFDILTCVKYGCFVQYQTRFRRGCNDALQSPWLWCHSHKQLTYHTGKYLIYFFFFQGSNSSSWFPGINFTIPT